MTRDQRAEIEARLLSGEDLRAVANDIGLDVIEDDCGREMIAHPGWWADDGNAAIEYDRAESGGEAAREYVDGGDWGDVEETTWIRVYVWREGVRAEVTECSYCLEAATAHDADGDPACAAHAKPAPAGVECQPIGRTVVVSRTERDSVTVALEPDEPDCADGADHDWRSPLSVVGGIAENPGVWGHGGGVIIREVCSRCGAYRVTDTWAQDRETGEQGLRSVRYEDADEESLAWIVRRRSA